MNKKIFLLLILPLILLGNFGVFNDASAHRSGCHRWHSCESDSGSYTCGDTGHCHYCADNYFCKNGTYNPDWQQNQSTAPTPTRTQNITPSNAASTQSDIFSGIPRTRSQLSRCLVVGNKYSHIYHLKGSRFIRSMSVSQKICFATELEAITAGFRKAKTR